MNRTYDSSKRNTVHGGQVEFNMVRHLLKESPALIAGFPLAMISRLDGDPRLPASSPLIERALQGTGVRARRTGSSVVVSGSGLIEMQNREPDGLLQGHDELWLFGEQRPVKSPPRGLTLIPGLGGYGSDYLEDGVPQAIEDWVLASGCILGLADNDCDLNYVTIDQTIADYLASFKEAE